MKVNGRVFEQLTKEQVFKQEHAVNPFQLVNEMIGRAEHLIRSGKENPDLENLPTWVLEIYLAEVQKEKQNRPETAA